jgi:hypothetical protein
VKLQNGNKQLMISSLFSTISKDERFQSIFHDLEMFKAAVDKEQALPKASASKRSVGRPKKEVHSQLLKPKLEQPLKKTKVRGSYTNWFCPSLWHPIHAAMRRHRNY